MGRGFPEKKFFLTLESNSQSILETKRGTHILELRQRGGFFWLRAAESQRGHLSFRNASANQWSLFFTDELETPGILEWRKLDLSKAMKHFLDALRPLPDWAIQTDRIYRKAGSKVICDGVFLHAKPGTVTAIMGPSGCGKSVFLKILAGYDRSDSGTVAIYGKAGKARFDDLGFTPQGHAMLAELTTEQALLFRLRMKFPFLRAKDCRQILERCCRLLNIETQDQWEISPRSGERIFRQATLHKKIGRTEWNGNFPSGGQRRRINIAYELILQPRVLLLDEPTSGLSSQDSEELMDSLVKLARGNGLTIITTIHQPSMRMFQSFDDLLLLTSGGKVCYYGAACYACASPFIAIDSNVVTNSAEALLQAVSSEAIGEDIHHDYESFIVRGVRESIAAPYLPIPITAAGGGKKC